VQAARLALQEGLEGLTRKERAGTENHGIARRLERIAGGIDDAHAAARFDAHRKAGGHRRARGVELACKDVTQALRALQVIVVARTGIGERGHQVLAEITAHTYG